MLRPFLIALAIHAFVETTSAAGWTTGPAPSWVDVAGPGSGKAPPASQGGYRCVLHEQQVLEAPNRHERFDHRIYRLETVEGARTFDGFSVDFDPAWQSLVFHWVRVLRDGKVLDRLDRSKIRALTREDGLDQGQIDGRRTLHMVLEDLRPGDVLDFAWTLAGKHPAFPGVASGSFRFSMPWALDRVRSRLVWMYPEPPNLLALHGAPEPRVRVASGVRDIVWDTEGVAAQKVPENVPDWWDDEPSADWTNLPGWGAIARIQSPFYKAADDPDPRAKALADRIARVETDSDRRVLRALRFLQDSIRYLGFEGGLGSHVPRPTSVTLASRQGDCKDKSLLLVALLRRMGIEAHPALVLSSGDRELDEHLPSPWFFDHVVVAVRLAGRTRMIDPTDRDQRGSLMDLPPIASRWALVLEPNSTGLVEVDQGEEGKPSFEIRDRWDARPGPGHPAVLERVILRRGRIAEAYRERLAKSSFEQELESELEKLRATYPDLRREGEPEVSEDDSTGWITWRSRFVSDGFWKQEDDRPVWRLTVAAPMIKDLAWDPGEIGERKAPLAISHPAWVRIGIQVLLPHRSWSEERNGDDPDLGALEYDFQSHLRPDTFGLDWDWRSRRDHVLPEELVAWKAAMDSIRSESEWTITLDKRSWTSKVNWPVLLLIPFVLGMGLWVARAFLRWSPRPPARVLPGTQAWMSGWWGLYLLGLVILPFRNLVALWEAGWLLDPARWNTSLEQDGTLALGALLETWVYLMLLPVWFALIRLFLKRRSAFPLANALAFGFLIAWLLLNSLILFLSGGDPVQEGIATTLASLPSTLVWVVYFLRAERSKAWFRTLADGTKVPLVEEDPRES